jgi:SAM-dependent methyltransferase
MTEVDPDADAHRFARESLAEGDPTGWFDRLYAAAAQGQAIVPWDRGTAHPMIQQWAETASLEGHGKRALVVGCGTGENAEYLSELGFDTVAFDIAPAAVKTAQARFPESQVTYVVADLLDPPAGWQHAFELVVEVFTVQALPLRLHAEAIANTSLMVTPGGTLVVLAGVSAPAPEQNTDPPWALTREEIDAFGIDGLNLVQLDTLLTPTGTQRWRAEFSRAMKGGTAQ